MLFKFLFKKNIIDHWFEKKFKKELKYKVFIIRNSLLLESESGWILIKILRASMTNVNKNLKKVDSCEIWGPIFSAFPEKR
jgi:hypothetical protein